MNVIVPPIKCHGIKTKLVRVIAEIANHSKPKWERWIEPFAGSCIVGLNVRPKQAVFADLNPHIIRFYQAIKDGEIDGDVVRGSLEEQGYMLSRKGEEYYYRVRDRFNRDGDPLDFLFLNRSCFNGLMRFNQNLEFNTPFCKRTNRFSKSHVTKIANQVTAFKNAMRGRDWKFVCGDFRWVLGRAGNGDMVYLDPPYSGLSSGYFSLWKEHDDTDLVEFLSSTESIFMLSTWALSGDMRNGLVCDYLSSCRQLYVRSIDHRYYVSPDKSSYSKRIAELIISNFQYREVLLDPEAIQETLIPS